MSLISRLVITTVLLTAALAGCKKEKPATAPADAASAALPPADAAAAPAVDAAAAPTVDAAPAAAKVTDAQIVAIVTAANTADIDAGKMAKSKTKNADVKKYADLMVKDHTAMNAAGAKVAKKAAITAEENDTSKKMKDDATASTEKLKAAPPAEFDKAYIESEIMMHQMVLDALDNSLIPSAQNADLKKALEDARTKVQAHLDAAKTIQGNLK